MADRYENYRLKRKKIFLTRKFLRALFSLTIFFSLSSVIANASTSSDCDITILNDREFFPALIKNIDSAKKEIIFSVFSFKTTSKTGSFPDKIVESLVIAVKRGVDITVILEDGKKTDDVFSANLETARKLKTAGIKVYFDSEKKTNHTKLYLFDETQVIVGSHNLTQSALKHNSEASILINSPKITKKYKEYIEKIKKVRF